MFKFVHHVEYTVKNRDEVVACMEQNFGMKPDKVFQGEQGIEAHYRVGQTIVKFKQPLPGSSRAQLLEKNGPGLHHIAWGVDNISEATQGLIAKGNTLLDSLTRRYALSSDRSYALSSDRHYKGNIDLKETLGFEFQIAEDPRP